MIASGERTFSRMSSFFLDLWCFLALENKQEKEKEVKDEIRNKEEHVVVG
jgi:hypothetical protein